MTVSLAGLRVQATRRIRRTGAAAALRRLARSLGGLAARTAPPALPRRYRWVRVGSLGPASDPVAGLVARDLLEPATPGQAARPHLVLVPGASGGGPTRLTERTVDALVECERGAVPTVLVATTAADLDAAPAPLCRDVVTADPEVYEAARARMGEARTHLVPAATAGTLEAWLTGVLEAADLLS